MLSIELEINNFLECSTVVTSETTIQSEYVNYVLHKVHPQSLIS